MKKHRKRPPLKRTVSEGLPFIARPGFYKDAKGNVFCSFAITEKVPTVIPEKPLYFFNQKKITDYRIMFFSPTSFETYGPYPFDTIMAKLRKYALSKSGGDITTRALTLSEIKEITEGVEGIPLSDNGQTEGGGENK